MHVPWLFGWFGTAVGTCTIMQVPSIPSKGGMCIHSVELLTNIPLYERARLVHPWPLRAPIGESLPFITSRTFPAVFCFSIPLGRFQPFFPFFFFRFVCVRVLGARHRGRARRRRGCQRALAGRGGVARNAVAVFVARRSVCLETRGKH